MGWPVCNTTLEDEKIEEIDLWEGGLTFHQLGLIISAAFALLATIISLYLIFQHATHYLRPREQRHIIRILFMVPVYALVSFLSYLYYQEAVYYEVLRDCYEAFAISAFFTLMCHYIAPDLHSQKLYFRGTRPKPWVWPLNWMQKCWGGENGIWRTPRSGLTWFNVIWVGVFQYCFVRVAMTIVAVTTQAVDLYCVASLSPAFSHIWVMVIVAICVTIAMYCLIQFYIQLRDDLKEYSPFLKILSIKLVIFLSFWQTITISFLTSAGAIKSSEKINTPDIKIGIPSVLLCIEMAMFSVLHLWAFAWQPYSLAHGANSGSTSAEPGLPPRKEAYQGGAFGLKAIGEAFNPWDLVKAIGRAAKWMFVGRKKRTQDPIYQEGEGGAMNLKPTAPDGDGENTTAYAGAGGTRRYGSSPDEEGEELLSSAQPNPRSSHSPVPSDSGIPPSPDADPYYESRGRQDSDTLLLGRSRDGSYSDPRPQLHVTTTGYPQDLPHEERMPSPAPIRYLPPSPDDPNPNQQKIGRFYEA